jgi:hypothetical protein
MAYQRHRPLQKRVWARRRPRHSAEHALVKRLMLGPTCGDDEVRPQEVLRDESRPKRQIWNFRINL